MKLTVPSTAIKSHFLKSLPLNTVYKDPRNEHIYEIQEKKFGSSFSKIAVPYFGQKEYIEVEVPDKYMKMENPERANIMLKMKERMLQLETLNTQLIAKLNTKSCLEQIIEVLDGNKYYETESEIFKIDNGIVFYLRRKDVEGNLKQCLDEFVVRVSKNPSKLSKIMERQQSFQKKLFNLLCPAHNSN
jgi:maltooligosyltrehalose synthase